MDGRIDELMDGRINGWIYMFSRYNNSFFRNKQASHPNFPYTYTASVAEMINRVILFLSGSGLSNWKCLILYTVGNVYVELIRDKLRLK